VDALLALIAEGDLRASPDHIVARAGVSLRTLWTQFKDLEGLYAAANERLIAMQKAEHRPIDPALPLPRRVEAFCAQRGRMLEIVAPAARAARLRLPFSAQLRLNEQGHVIRATAEIAAAFPVELARVDHREELTRALLVSMGWPAWAMLRDELGLSEAEAVGVMVRTVSALLGAQR
jgi:AcrR family transcriptional regulator